MTRLILKFFNDEEIELIKDITKLSQKSPGFDSDSEMESESASELNKSDSDPEYFPSSDSSDDEFSTSCSQEPSKSTSDDECFDIFPSIPKIYSDPRTYQKSKIILVKKNCKTNRKSCKNELAVMKDPRINLDFDNENDMIENQLENNSNHSLTTDEIRAMFESVFPSDEDI